ncbi:MAG: hypothetical protein GY765_03445, partial [bacterium]|nr:hypothetical protein [bacterium]
LPCETIGHNHFLGRATESEVDLEPDRIAGAFNSIYKKVETYCNSCRGAGICGACIFNVMVDKKGKPFCPGFKSMAEMKEYLTETMEYFEIEPSVYKLVMKEVTVNE